MTVVHFPHTKMTLQLRLAALLAIVHLTPLAQLHAAVALKKPSPTLDPIANALAASPAAPRIVDLSGDKIADAARLTREAQNEKVIYTIGPDATAAAGDASVAAKIVAIGVPNPAKMKANATYLSVYPRYDRVLSFAATQLKAKRVAFLFTPSQNREIAAELVAASTNSGVTITPVAVNSVGELVRSLKETLPSVDAVILAIDPIDFDRLNVRFIVEAAGAQRKPVIGFLPELLTAGVTIALTVDPSAVVAAAVEEASTPPSKTRKVRQLDSFVISVSRRSAERIGLNVESLGAQKIQ